MPRHHVYIILLIDHQDAHRQLVESPTNRPVTPFFAIEEVKPHVPYLLPVAFLREDLSALTASLGNSSAAYAHKYVYACIMSAPYQAL